MPKIVFEYTSEELNRLQWQIIVECWSRKRYGRGKRGWEDTFTPEERAKIVRYHREHLSPWMFRTGVPTKHRMKPETYHLLARAVQFFAEQT